MKNSVSTNFLLLKDNEQKQILFYLSKDFRRKQLYQQFAHLYSLKMEYIRQQKMAKPPVIQEPKKTETKAKPEKKVEPKKPLPKSIIKYTPNFQKYIDKFLVQEKLKKEVENLEVAIVGPANYLLNLNQGEKIDNYDIVIRFNSGIIQQHSKNLGERTDIWIYNFKDLSLLDKIPDTPPKLIFCPYPKSIIDSYNIDAKLPNIPIEFIEPVFYSQLQQAMNFEPNSALLTILILLRQNISKLYVTGISFFYDGYYDHENNQEKNNKISSGELIVAKEGRNSFMSIIKKVYNANDKLYLDNTMINLLYPNFINVLNNLFASRNHKQFFSTLDYFLFVPTFQQKYNSPHQQSKIYVHFGKQTLPTDLHKKMHLIIHDIKPRMFANEVFVKHSECNYDDIEDLLKIKNKGIVYFSNNHWQSIKNMIPEKNKSYIMSHHCYVNGNIYGSFIKYIVKDFDIAQDTNLNMLYILFCLIYYGQKIVYVNQQDMWNCGMKEIGNVMQKLNLIKFI